MVVVQGGQSVAVHVVSPLSAGLFHGAISQSGDMTATRSLSEALDLSSQISHGLSCSDGECLQQRDGSALLATAVNLTKVYEYEMAKAVIDNYDLEATPVEMAEASTFNRVPYIIGNNADEGSAFVPVQHVSAAQARCVIERSWDKATAESILEIYPLLTPEAPGSAIDPDNRPVLVQLLSDVFFHCANRR